MKFGERVEDVGQESTGAEARFMRTVKVGENRFRFLQEVKDWVRYYEHYNPAPGGFSFPCTRDKTTCPGCTSGVERMATASRKYAVNALVGGFVDIYKLPLTVKNRMEIRSERNGGTIIDRDYLITRTGKDTNTEYDVEGLNPGPADMQGKSLHDIEAALQASFNEAWPNWSPTQAAGSGTTSPVQDRVRTDSAAANGADKPETQDHPLNEFAPKPKEETVVSEADLRKMDKPDLLDLLEKENIQVSYDMTEYADVDQIVDWLLTLQS